MKDKRSVTVVLIAIIAVCLLTLVLTIGMGLHQGWFYRLQEVPTALTRPPSTPSLPPESSLSEIPPQITPSSEPTAALQPIGKIVFTCQLTVDGDDEICLMNADGTGFRQLTFNGAENYYPSLAPDGGAVVFSSNMTGIFEIYEMDLVTGLTLRLTNDLHEAFAPEISPDGRAIVFAANYAQTSSIWLMDRDGAGPHQVFRDPGQDSVDPTWSPDGSRILFALGVSNQKQLMTMTLDGMDLRPVSTTFRTRGRSDWSADAAIIGAYSGSAPHWEVFFMNPDGSGLRQVTFSGRNLAPSFSPDSQWMVYTSYGGNNSDPDACEIYIMRVDGSQETRLTNNDYCDWQPRWGP